MQSQEKNVLKKLLRCFYWQLIVLNIPRGNEPFDESLEAKNSKQISQQAGQLLLQSSAVFGEKKP